MGDGDREVESQLNLYVRDYLQYVDLNKTVATLDDELQQLGRPLPPGGSTDALKNEVKSKMMAALEAGDHKKFFELWNDAIPQHVRANEGHKIEFYINIYFAVFPIHPLIKATTKPKLADTMQIFGQFLATKGADLSKTSAFLAFYALPYVPDPSSHPSFQDLFTSEWLSELRTRVDKFLGNSVKPARPGLFRAYEFLESKSKIKSRSDDDTRYIQSLEQAKENYVKQCDKLQNEKADLLLVGNELVQALQQVLDGHMLSQDHLHSLFSNVAKVFPSTTSVPRKPPSTPRGRKSSNSSPGSAGRERERERGERGERGEREREERVGERPLPTLDYTKIQRELLNPTSSTNATSSPGLVARILQALRWRLTRSEVGIPRRRVFQTYVSHDILACTSAAPRNVLATILSPSAATVVREYAARLVNCMSCECPGRAYLLQHRQIIEFLWDILATERADTIVRQQALGALQKLSLRKKAQTTMIEMGAVDWILGILQDVDSISKYTLEYGSALLLNLSLRASGRKCCESSQHDVLKILSDLLECDNLQVRFYTNGTLYSVLDIPSLRERAKEMGMEDILKYVIKSSDENFANQIEYIVRQLNREDGESENDEEEEDEEDDDDNDELVGDEEEAPEILPNDGQPTGESLLCSLYLAKTSDAQREDEEVRKSLDLRKVSLSSLSPRSSSPSSPSPRPSSSLSSSSSFDNNNNFNNSMNNNGNRGNRMQSAPIHRTQSQQQMPQRPVTPGGYSNLSMNSTMQNFGTQNELKQEQRQRPRTPGSLSNKEVEDMQSAFGTRAKMARTPQSAPAVPLEPLPQIKPRPKKKT